MSQYDAPDGFVVDGYVERNSPTVGQFVRFQVAHDENRILVHNEAEWIRRWYGSALPTASNGISQRYPTARYHRVRSVDVFIHVADGGKCKQDGREIYVVAEGERLEPGVEAAAVSSLMPSQIVRRLLA